jgi:hypothetical protein
MLAVCIIQVKVWWTARPRSTMSSCKSRNLTQKRRYQRTQVMITSGCNFRLQNNGGRPDLMAYATKSAAATLPFGPVSPAAGPVAVLKCYFVTKRS